MGLRHQRPWQHRDAEIRHDSGKSGQGGQGHVSALSALRVPRIADARNYKVSSSCNFELGVCFELNALLSKYVVRPETQQSFPNKSAWAGALNKRSEGLTNFRAPRSICGRALSQLHFCMK